MGLYPLFRWKTLPRQPWEILEQYLKRDGLFAWENTMALKRLGKEYIPMCPSQRESTSWGATHREEAVTARLDHSGNDQYGCVLASGYKAVIDARASLQWVSWIRWSCRMHLNYNHNSSETDGNRVQGWEAVEELRWFLIFILKVHR